MVNDTNPRSSGRWALDAAGLASLILVVVWGGYLRFSELGVRSLWLDEFCTWHVSRMAPAESLRWAPELTKPPLYQFTLRALTGDPRPAEWLLRFPAAFAGVLAVVAACWLGKVSGGWATALALAALLACNTAQLDVSREARSYTMLALGCTVSITLWYRLVVAPGRRYFFAYILVTVLTFHAHYLTVLTACAQACWWLVLRRAMPGARRSLKPLGALLIAGVLCVPMTLHYLRYQTSIFQGLDWIPPPTWGTAFAILARLTFGGAWVLAALVPSMLLWVLDLCGMLRGRRFRSKEPLSAGGRDICGLLGIWLLFAWGGLLVVSWAGHPVLVQRYALPAAVPALLFPLIIAGRMDRRVPLVLMGLIVIGTAPLWLRYGRDPAPGFRELSAFLNEHVEPDEGAVVLAIDGTVPSEWAEMERLGFRYYVLKDLPVRELAVGGEAMGFDDPVLQDPRTLYVVVFRADPLPALRAAGRRCRPFRIDDKAYSQLSFAPYRLLQVAPLSERGEVPNG